MLSNQSILIAGGIGSCGNTIVSITLAKYNLRRVVIYLWGEMKQWEMDKPYANDPRVRRCAR